MKYFFIAIFNVVLFIVHCIFHPLYFIGKFIWTLKIISFRTHLIQHAELNECSYREIENLRQESFSQTFLRWLKGKYYV